MSRRGGVRRSEENTGEGKSRQGWRYTGIQGWPSRLRTGRSYTGMLDIWGERTASEGGPYLRQGKLKSGHYGD